MMRLTALPHGPNCIDEVNGGLGAHRVWAEGRVATDGLVAEAIGVVHGTRPKGVVRSVDGGIAPLAP